MPLTDYKPVLALYDQIKAVRRLTIQERERYDRLFDLHAQQEHRRKHRLISPKKAKEQKPSDGAKTTYAISSKKWRERNPEKYAAVVQRQRERRGEQRKERLREKIRQQAESNIPPIEVGYWLRLMAA